jgi:hypothetical protein
LNAHIPLDGRNLEYHFSAVVTLIFISLLLAARFRYHTDLHPSSWAPSASAGGKSSSERPWFLSHRCRQEAASVLLLPRRLEDRMFWVAMLLSMAEICHWLTGLLETLAVLRSAVSHTSGQLKCAENGIGPCEHTLLSKGNHFCRVYNLTRRCWR